MLYSSARQAHPLTPSPIHCIPKSRVRASTPLHTHINRVNVCSAKVLQGAEPPHPPTPHPSPVPVPPACPQPPPQRRSHFLAPPAPDPHERSFSTPLLRRRRRRVVGMVGYNERWRTHSRENITTLSCAPPAPPHAPPPLQKWKTNLPRRKIRGRDYGEGRWRK